MSDDKNGCNTLSNTSDADAGLQRVAGARQWPPPLPASQVRFREAYEALAAGLVSDRGGPEGVTTAELALIETTCECFVVARKLARRLFVRGVTKRHGELQPALASYFTAVNSLRLNLIALGLDRRARELPSLEAYVAGRGQGGPSDAENPAGGAKRGDLREGASTPSVEAASGQCDRAPDAEGAA